jgi:hypothetical protein
MKRLAFALVLWLTPFAAFAQCNGVFPALTLCGNPTGAPGIPQAVPNSVLTGVPGGSPGQFQFNNSGVFGGVTIPNCTVGSLQYNSSSNTFSCTAPANTTVTGAATTYTSSQNIVNRSNAGAPMSDLLPGTGPGVLPNGSSLTIVNADTTGILSIKTGAGASILTAKASSGFVYLCPGQSIVFNSDGSNYRQTSPWFRCQFQANTSIFINAGTGSNSNDGLTSSTPFVDMTFAYSLVQNSFDINSKVITFSVANGTYPQTTISGPLVGTSSPTNLTRTVLPVLFVGNPGSPSSVIISSSLTFGAVQVMYGAVANFNGFQIVNSASNSLFAHFNSVIQMQNIVFPAIGAFNHITSEFGADIVIFGNYTISGGAGCHMITSNQGQIETNGAITPVVTLTGTPNFSSAFACVQYPGIITIQGPITYSGAATGARYGVGTNGAIVGTGGVAGFFPGNSAGTTSNGGQYN